MTLLHALPTPVQDIVVTAKAESFTQAHHVRVTRPACMHVLMGDDGHKKIRVSTKTEDKAQALAVLQLPVEEHDQRRNPAPWGWWREHNYH